MPRARIQTDRPQRQGQRPQREGMSESHLSMVRRCPCLICGRYPCDAHHLLRTGEHGMSRKSSDRWAVPLCGTVRGAWAHHKGKDSPHAHGNEDEWFALHGLDGRAIARALWSKRGDYEAMRRIAENAAQRVRTG